MQGRRCGRRLGRIARGGRLFLGAGRGPPPAPGCGRLLGQDQAARRPAVSARGQAPATAGAVGQLPHGRPALGAARRGAIRARPDRQPFLHCQRRLQPWQEPADHRGALHQRRQGKQRLRQRHRVHPGLSRRPGAVRGVDAGETDRGPAMGEFVGSGFRRWVRRSRGEPRQGHPAGTGREPPGDRPGLPVPRARHRLPEQRERPHHVRQLDVAVQRHPAQVRMRRLHRRHQRQPVGDEVHRRVAHGHDRRGDRRLPGGRRYAVAFLQRPLRARHPRPLPAGGHGRGGRPADRLRHSTAARAGVHDLAVGRVPGSSRPAGGNPGGTELRDSPRRGRDRHGGSR